MRFSLACRRGSTVVYHNHRWRHRQPFLQLRDFGSGFLAAGVASLGDSQSLGSDEADTALHAVLGGVGSVAGGGKFADGAVTGAFGYLFNKLVHPPSLQIADALDQLRKIPEMTGVVDELMNAKENFTIQLNNMNINKYVRATSTIWWDPSSSLRTTEGGWISPTLVLGHELGHASRPSTAYQFWMKIQVTFFNPGNDDNWEEYRVITYIENPAARAVGQAVRTDHRGDFYNATGVNGQYVQQQPWPW